MAPVVGVVGTGFVGEACVYGFERNLTVHTYDIAKPCTQKSLLRLSAECDVIFVCVPTPMASNGQVDTSIVERVVLALDQIASRCEEVVIKSTVPPGTTERLQQQCENITLFFNPEFLTEANYINDFLDQDRILIGLDFSEESYDNFLLSQVYDICFPEITPTVAPTKEMEMVKYLTNNFLAMKVVFANEMHAICQAGHIDYNSVVEIAKLDGRLGKSHWQVPGPDGKFGFGGTCFPKDLMGMTYYADSLGSPAHFLEDVWAHNVAIRGEKDWEKLKGRAVSYPVKQTPPMTDETPLDLDF